MCNLSFLNGIVYLGIQGKNTTKLKAKHFNCSICYMLLGSWSVVMGKIPKIGCCITQSLQYDWGTLCLIVVKESEEKRLLLWWWW